MEFVHYEINPKELKKALKNASKYGRMIDPKHLVDGHCHLADVQCKGCGKIQLKNSIKKCEKCNSIICDYCFKIGMTAIDDDFYQKVQDGFGEDFLSSV